MNKNKTKLRNSIKKYQEDHHRLKLYTFIGGITILFFLLIYLLNGGITGLMIGNDQWESYQYNLSLNVQEDGNEVFVVEDHPELFNLKSLKLSGKVIGNGSVKVYLKTDDQNYLILDRDSLKDDWMDMVTGFIVAVSEGEVEEESEEEDSEEEEIAEEESEEDEEQEEIKEDSEDEAIEESEDIVEESEEEQDGSTEEGTEVEEDSGDDDTEEDTDSGETGSEDEENIENVEEEEVEEGSTETGEQEEVDEEQEVTVPEQEETEPETNETVDLPEGSVGNVTEELNVTIPTDNSPIPSQNITLNSTISDLEINATLTNVTNTTLNGTNTTSGGSGSGGGSSVTPIINETVLNNTETTNETLVNESLEELEIIEEEPETYHVNITYKEFEPEVLDVKVGDTVVWHNLREERMPQTAMIIGARNPYTSIRSEELGQGETYSWTFDSPGTYWIVDGIITTMDSKIVVTGDGEEFGEFREIEENVTEKNVTTLEINFEDYCQETCLLPPGLNLTEFELVFEVEEGTELELESVWYALEDLTEPPIEVEFGVVDMSNDLIEAEIMIDGINETLSSGDDLSLEKRLYSLEIVPDNHTIRNLDLSNVNLIEDVDKIIKLDQDLEIADIVQSYAIKELVDFETAEITIVAKGNNLYKCDQWNTLWDRCSSEFELHKTIFINETYTVEINSSLSSSIAFIESLENITNVTYLKVKDDPRYDAIISSAEVGEDGTLTVIFHHDSPTPLPISIIGRIENFTLDKNISSNGENVTLTVPGFDKKKFFRIKVGSASEVFEFGEPEQFELNAEILDSNQQEANFTIEVTDVITEEVDSLGDGNEEKSVDEGIYDIKLNLDDNPIKSIEIKDIELFENVTLPLSVEDTNEHENNLTEFVEVYSIDPTEANFTNAIVTVTATGTTLYKCKDWNFTTQSCYGEWSLFKTGLTPGEEYTFKLTPDDPGFGEIINITEASHLDENRAFIEEIYNETYQLDGVWSPDIPAGHYVRVAFEQNLTSDKDITVYARSNSSANIEVYTEGSDDLITTINNITNEDYYKTYLTGMVGAYDTFDLKIVGDSIEFDHITDPKEVLGESGSATVSDSLSWNWISYDNTYTSTPVVIATPATINNCPGTCSGNTVGNGGMYPIPLVKDVSTSGFNFSMCVDGGNAACSTGMSSETFHYFVFDVDNTANYDWIEVGTTASVGTNGVDTVETLSSSFTGTPEVWTQAQTYSQNGNMGATAWVEDDGKSTTAFTYVGCVHQAPGSGTSEDTCESGQPSETFGYVAIDTSHANFSEDVGFQFGSADISNSAWTAATFSPTYTTPRVMVTQNDDDGGQDPEYAWAKDVVSGGMDFRYCEQDTGTECNSHTGEKVYWFAMEDGDITVGEADPQTPPTTPTSITCDGGSCNNTFYENVEINCSGSTDAEADAITYNVWANYSSTGGGSETIEYQRAGGSTGTSHTIDIGQPGNDRLVVVMLDDESTPGATYQGTVSIGANNANQLLVADNSVGAGNHMEMHYFTESDLGALSGSQTISYSGGDSGWAMHVQVFYNVKDGAPYDSQIDQTSAVESEIDPAVVDIPANGVLIFGAAHGSSGTYNDADWDTSPTEDPDDGLTPEIEMTEVTDGPQPSSAFFATAYWISSTTVQNNRQFRARVAVADNYRGTGTIASWEPASSSGASWNEIGNHSDGGSYTWNITNITDQSDVDLRCRAIDLSGSNTYSSYYDPSVNLTITSTPANNAPSASTITDSPDPQAAGSDVTFSGSWSEPDSGDQVKMYVCKDASCTNCDSTSQSNCWCYSSSWQTEPDTSDTCTYTVQEGDSETNNYWMTVCDDDNACDTSPLSGGTWNKSDTTPPASVTGLGESSTGQTWIYWAWTNPGDADFDGAIVYVDGINEVNTSNEYYNKTSLTCGNSHNITVHTKDTNGNVNDTDVIDSANTAACPDTAEPTYSNINEPTDPSTYSPSATYNFNATWQDNTAVDEVILEFDGTNYSYQASELTKTGDVYYKNFGALAAGTYNYKWYANDTSNNWNETSTLSFTVNQATSTLTLESSPSWTENYGTETTVNCTSSTPQITPTLYRDGTPVSIPDTQTLAATTYDYVCNATATQNYSAPSEQQNTLTINQIADTTNLYLNGNLNQNDTITYGTESNATGTSTTGTESLYRDGTPVSNPEITTLAAGTYTYKVNSTGNENYTGDSTGKTYYLTVNQVTSTCNLVFDKASPQTYGTQVNASCSCTNSEASAVLYRNSVDVTSTENNQLITLSSTTHNYVCNTTATQNYTAAQDTDSFTINKAVSVVNLTLDGTDNNISIIHDVTVNITATKVTGDNINIKLYEDGVLINEGTSPLENLTSYSVLGNKNITVIYEESENYTASSETHWITVTNSAPTLDAINATPETAQQGETITVTTINASDSDGDNYQLRCGDASNTANLCNSTSGTGERSCNFNSPWSDDTSHTVYCKLFDSYTNSTEKTDTVNADNTAPSSNFTSVDGDISTPYWDTSNNSQTILAASTEVGASCRYGTSDVQWSSMSNDCAVASGDINCNLGNVAQVNSTTYHISCKDQYGNEQTNSENIDVTFGVDYTQPTTYDDYDGDIKIPGLLVTIHETDIPVGVIITTYYCNDTDNTCSAETLIDDQDTVQFDNRGTNYLRYYSVDEANNTQDLRSTQIFINQLVDPGTPTYTNSSNEHSFNVTVTPSDADTQEHNCTLYHRLNGVGGYSNKSMTESGSDYVTTISTSDGYSVLDTVQMIVECTDGLEAVNNTATTHPIPNNAPATPTLTSPGNETSITVSYQELSYSSTDAETDTITYYVYGDTNTNPTTLLYSGTDTSYNWTGLSTNTYYWKVIAGDGYENSSVSEIREFAVDNSAPVYSNINEPTDPSTYSATYNFNITWTDYSIDDVILEFDGVNYSYDAAELTKTGDVYSKDIGSLAVGTYNYKWYANDTGGYNNETDQFTFTVNQASTTTQLYLNGAESNQTITYGTQSNATATTSAGTVTLYRDGTPVSNPEIDTLTGGTTYNYTAINPGNQNYTGSEVTYFLTVNKATSEVNLLLDGTDGNITIEVGDTVNETGNLVTGTGNIELYEEGAQVNIGTSPLTNLTTYNSLGTFNVSIYYFGNENYTAVSETHYITVQDTTNPTINLESPVDGYDIATQTQQFDFNVSDNYYSTLDCTLYIGGTQYDNNASVSTGTSTTLTGTSIPEGNNNWNITCVDASSNSITSETRELSVDLTPPDITLVRPTENDIIGYIVTLDADITDTLLTVDSAWYEIKNSTGDVVKSSTLTAPLYQDIWDTTTVGDGSYTFIVYANDTVNNEANSSATFTIDNTQPFIQILTPTNGSRHTENFNLDITYQNTWLNETSYNITNSSGTIVQQNSDTNVQATTDSYTDQVSVTTLPDGTYTITAYSLDSVGYTTTEQTQFIVDNSAPQYSNIIESPTDPATYSPTATYTFNITWTDASIDDIWLIFDGVTYSYNAAELTKNGNVYSKTLPALAVGTYDYTWYANDTIGNGDNTGTLTYTVNKETTTLTLTSDPSWTETHNQETTINCSAENDQVTPQLYLDGSPVSIPYTTTHAADTYNYTCSATATQNYTADTVSNILTINKASTSTNLYLNGQQSNITITYPDQINATAITSNLSLTLYRDGVPVSNPEITTLAAGTYNYTAINLGNENFTGSSVTYFVTVNKDASEVNLLLNGEDDDITVEVHSIVNETGQLTLGESIIELYEDGVLVNTGSSPLFNQTQYSTLGIYNVTVTYPETENYTTSSETHLVTVQDTTDPTINLESPVDGYDIAVQTQQFSFNTNDNYYSTLNCTLYIGGTAYDNNVSVITGESTILTGTGIPEGNNNWNITCLDSSGNSITSETRELTIDLTSPDITLVRPSESDIIGYTVTLDADLTDNLLSVDSVWYEIKNSSTNTVKSGTFTAPLYQDIWDTTTVGDGNYTFIVYANDTVSNEANSSATFTVDNTQPFIQILTPTNGSRHTENFNLDITYQNTWLNETSYNITNSSGTIVQQNSDSNVQATTDSYSDQVNVTTLPDGTYTITAYSLDSVGYTTTEQTQFIVDNSAPQYSNINEPTDPSTYSQTQNYEFSITWTDESIDDIWLVFDGVTYTDLTQNGNSYSRTFGPLPAGTYEYTWYANDTIGNEDNTGTLSFTINKDTPTLTLSSSPSWTNTYETETTINCSSSTPQITPHLYRNGIEVSIPDVQTLAATTYNYVCDATATQNYTAPAQQQNTLTINKYTTTTNLYLNGAENNLTVTYPEQVNATAITDRLSLTLYRNGQVVSNPEIGTLAAGTYNYTAMNPGNENYTASQVTYFVIVNKDTSAVNLLLNENDSDISIIHDWPVNITATRDNGESIIELYQDGTLINSGTNTLTNITSYHELGTYNITVIYTETENYTASYETHFITVTNELPTLDSISVSPTTAKLNEVINISTSNANDADNDNYTLRCGDSSGTSNLCNSTVFSTGSEEVSCTFNNPWNDDIAHTIYCRLDDTVNVSSEKTVIFTADNTAPTSSLTAVDGDTSAPYWDTSNNSQTIISGTTETGASCRWGTEDQVYSAMSNDCSVSDGSINCNLGNVAEIVSTTYYLSCKDQYDNEQTTDQNLDVTFGVDHTEPTTYDDYDGNIKLPGHQVTIHEEDLPNSTVITTWYCTPTIGCTPETVIDDGENVTFNNRGTNYLRYYSQDEAENTQDTRTTQVLINNLINIGSLEFTDNAGHSFITSITPTDDDSSQNTTCTLYHRLNGVGNYSSKAMTGTTTKTATISEADGYTPLQTVQLYTTCTDDMEIVNTTPETHQLSNNIPAIPTLVSPTDNTVVTEEEMILLEYSSSDLDNDTITYYVYGDTNANPTILLYNGTLASYNWTLTRNNNGIQNNYWKILASDSYQNSSFSEIRTVIVNDTKDISITSSEDQDTNRSVNATYTITLTNNGAVTENFTLSLNNLNNASTAQLSQSTLTLAAGASRNVTLDVTDDDTVSEYDVDVTVTSDTDPTVTDTVSVTTTVYGTLSAYVTAPSGSPPPIYYEGQSIEFEGYVYDELSNAINGATVTFEPTYGSYTYLCDNVSNINGYYNCTKDTSGMERSYYNVQVNASKTYYHTASYTNNSLFILSDSKEADLTLYKLPSIVNISEDAIVYNISNILANLRGLSENSTIIDPDANQTWNEGTLAAETVTESYLLEFVRGDNVTLVTLNKSNATGYDSLYKNNLFTESNQPVIAIPENESLDQLTLLKNLVVVNQTTTNITYQVTIEVVNSGENYLEEIEITDTDLNIDTKINLSEGESWQTSSNLVILKQPQTHTKSFVRSRASADGDIFYSNQLDITIPGYGGPFDVIIHNLPSSVYTSGTVTANVETINQNTEIAEGRWLTTVIMNEEGVIYDIDIRTIYVGRNQSLTSQISLTAPSSPGTYYYFSEIVWPTAKANATASFQVVNPPVPASSESGGGGGAATSTVKETVEGEIMCGDRVCDRTELNGGVNQCIDDCGYDCDGDDVQESWNECKVAEIIPEDVKEDLILLMNKVNELETENEKLVESGVDNTQLQQMINNVKDLIDDAEEQVAKGNYDWARNIIRNAYSVLGTTIIVYSQDSESMLTGAAGIDIIPTQTWNFLSTKIVKWVILILGVMLLLTFVVYKKVEHDEELELEMLHLRRRRLELMSKLVDLDNLTKNDAKKTKKFTKKNEKKR